LGKETQGERTDLKKDNFLSFNDKKSHNQKDLSKNDKSFQEPHNTQKEIAKDLNWSIGKTAQADVVKKNADENTKQKLRKGDMTIHPREIMCHEKLTEKHLWAIITLCTSAYFPMIQKFYR